MTLNSHKCQFSTRSVKFLGHIVNSEGVRADPGKVDAMQRVQPPATVGEVRRFFNMITQLRKIAPNLAVITQPLRELLIRGNRLVWGEPQQRAFSQIKEVLDLLGLKFHIQTDHKPLVPLFSCKYLEELLIQDQIFHLRMMSFKFSNFACSWHIPGHC